MKLSEKSDRDPYQEPHQEGVRDPCCETYVQPSAVLSSWDQSNLKWSWMTKGVLQSHSLAASTCSGGQSFITYFCVDRHFGKLQISLFGELRQFGHCIDI